MAKIGFIGMGNMGSAMLQGVMKVFEKDDILFTRKNEALGREMAREKGIRYVESNAELVNNVKYLILAVKPQVYPQVIKNIENVITKEHVVISLAPGISIEYLTDMLGFDSRVVRAMPNTPALLGEGMTGVSYDASMFTLTEKDMLDRIFKSFGKYVQVDEKLMSAVTCASGSSPAYVYLFIEALADSVVKYGISRQDAYELVAQTVLGAAKMVLETEKHPGELKDAVCSPGGTTIQGVAALEEYGFRNSIMKATDACYAKAEGMK